MDSKCLAGAAGRVLLAGLCLTAFGCSQKAEPPSDPGHAVVAQDSIAWPGLTAAPGAASAPAAATVKSMPSVSSMVDGLRKRLEQDPDDAKGWALLAQSYAFTGDPDAAEQALARAVELGMDEQDLRQRVAAASQPPRPETDWVQQALNR